jgi:hypothetical protein
MFGDVQHVGRASLPTFRGDQRIVAPSCVQSSTGRPHPCALKGAPSSADRVIDAAALLMVLGGVSLFVFARHVLTGIGNGTHAMPDGISAVAVADFHVAQTKVGLWIVGLGVLTGVVAAVRHRFRS